MAMHNLVIGNWNIERMNRWFSSDNAGSPALKPSGRIAGVTNGMNADIVTINTKSKYIH